MMKDVWKRKKSELNEFVFCLVVSNPEEIHTGSVICHRRWSLDHVIVSRDAHFPIRQYQTFHYSDHRVLDYTSRVEV